MSFDGIVTDAGLTLPYGPGDKAVKEPPQINIAPDGEGGVRVECMGHSGYFTPQAMLEFAGSIEAIAHLAEMGSFAFSGPHLGMLWAVSEDVPPGTVRVDNGRGEIGEIVNIGTD